MTDLDELQIKLDRTIELINNSQYDDAISELKDGIDSSECSVCKMELSILSLDIVHNRDICILGSDSCNEEKEAVIEKITELKKDFELAKDYI